MLCDFYFEFIFRDLDKPGKLFFPDINPGSNLTLKGWFKPEKNDIFLESQTDIFALNDFYIRHPRIEMVTKDTGRLSLTLNSQGIHLSPQLDFDEFSAVTNIRNDSLGFRVHWF